MPYTVSLMAQKVDVQRKAVKGAARGQSRAARGQSRGPLSRDRVLAAAIRLADEEGIDGLSMRRLAQGLGVEAMSLYHWFPNKDALLGAMVDAVYDEVQLPARGQDWRADMRATAISTQGALLRHGWATGLLMTATSPSPARLRYMDAILGRLRAAGFSAHMTHHAYHALESHTVGYVLWVLPYLALSKERPDLAERFLEDLPTTDMPHLVEHVNEHINPSEKDDFDEFEFGLDVLLDGLEDMRTRPH